MLIGVTRRHDEDPGERDEHGRAADGERDAGRDDAAEHEEEGQGGQRKRDELAPRRSRLRDGLDVAVERGAAADADPEAGHVAERGGDGRDRVRGVVGREVQEDDVVGGVAVRRHLAGGEDVGQDARDVRRAGDVLRGLRDRREPPGRAGRERVRGVDEDERRRLQAQLRLEDLLRARGLEVVQDEAARGQRSGRLGCERDREQDEDGPRGDDPPAAADGEAAETIEGHAFSGSAGRGRRMAARVEAATVTCITG